MGKKNKNQKASQSKKSTKNFSKKTQQVFKIAQSTATKKGIKKTQEIPKKLKQLDLKTKDKANQQLKDLHLKMVSKKEVKETKALGKKKLPSPNTDQVQEVISKKLTI